MDDAGLRRALRGGLETSDWHRLLNSKVFFWLTSARLQRMLDAKAYRGKRQTVITVDTRLLLERHLERIVLSPINSGCTKPIPHYRGASTFAPLSLYPFSERMRRRLEPAVELAVDHGVLDIADLVLTVEEVGAASSAITLVRSE
jgi:hypothetical protein